MIKILFNRVLFTIKEGKLKKTLSFHLDGSYSNFVWPIVYTLAIDCEVYLLSYDSFKGCRSDLYLINFESTVESRRIFKDLLKRALKSLKDLGDAERIEDFLEDEGFIE